MLSKTSTSDQLLAASTCHCGAVSTRQAVPGDGKALEMWLQGMGVADLGLQKWESSRTVTAGMVKP